MRLVVVSMVHLNLMIHGSWIVWNAVNHNETIIEAIELLVEDKNVGASRVFTILNQLKVGDLFLEQVMREELDGVELVIGDALNTSTAA